MVAFSRESLVGANLAAFIPTIVVVWSLIVIGPNPVQERIVNACGLVVQMDSFFAAGYFASLFWFLGVFIRKGVKEGFRGGFVYFISRPVIGLTVGSFSAVAGVVSGTGLYLVAALGATAWAVFEILATWYSLIVRLNRLIISDKA